VLLDGDDVTQLPPAARNIGYVPQDGALFPRMSVRRHLAFPLAIRGWAKADIQQRTDELAQRLAIGPLLDRLPAKLSGGERQRVALGRALSFHPPTLVLDEPLSALDEPTRDEMHHLLKSIQQETGATTLHITHSRHEATLLADHLFELRDGKIVTAADDPVKKAVSC
jgi:ABC-type sugar transport system ATPase subunit